MKTKLILSMLVISSLAITYSCKKDSIIPPTVYDTYLPLKVGNYWIYEEVQIDSNGTETPLSFVDSNYVEKDTIINGLTYYKVHKPNHFFPDYCEILRDSLHYIVDERGLIKFSSNDFTNTFNTSAITITANDTAYVMYRKMEPTTTTVNVTAGSFICYNAKETYHMYPGWDNGGPIQYSDCFYSKDVGIVKERMPFFTYSPTNQVKKLIRYHLN